MAMGPIDWGAVFALDKPVLELFVRVSIMSLVVFVILRAVLRRASGALATFGFVFYRIRVITTALPRPALTPSPSPTPLGEGRGDVEMA